MTKIVFTGKYRRYDGEIVFEDERRQKVELTVATDGHQEADTHGTQSKEWTCSRCSTYRNYGGKKNNRIFHDDKNVLEAIDLREYEHNDAKSLLEVRLKQKIEKAKKIRTTMHGWV